MTTEAIIEAILQFGIPGGLAIWLVHQLVSANNGLGRVIAKKDDQYAAIVDIHAREQTKNTEKVTEALANNTSAMREQSKTMTRLTEKIDRMGFNAPTRETRGS